MTTFVGAGPTSVHVPTFANSGATQSLREEYARDPRRFPINRYVETIPTSKNQGKYLRIDSDEAVRVFDEKRYEWADRQRRPAPDEYDHAFLDFSTRRRAPGFRLGARTIRPADWNIVASHARFAAAKCMTIRAKVVLDKIADATNWTSGTNEDSATTLSGGKWSAATVANPYIQKTVNAVSEAINLNTNGIVTPDMIRMVIGTDVAKAISESPEIKEWLYNHGRTIEFLMGRGPKQSFTAFGVLAPFFGIGDVVVENTVIITGVKKRGTVGTKSRLLSDKALFLTRERLTGERLGEDESAITVSTIALFAFEDMTVETRSHEWHRFTEGSVVDDIDVQITAPLSGYLVTDVLA